VNLILRYWLIVRIFYNFLKKLAVFSTFLSHVVPSFGTGHHCGPKVSNFWQKKYCFFKKLIFNRILLVLVYFLIFQQCHPNFNYRIKNCFNSILTLLYNINLYFWPQLKFYQKQQYKFLVNSWLLLAHSGDRNLIETICWPISISP
jgi:hypothetical protein